MANAWIEHIKSFAEKHNMSYKDALKNPQCKASYHKGGKVPTGMGRYRPMTQKQFYSLTPEYQHHHIQQAHHHHLSGGWVPNWLKKIGNFAKDAGKTVLKVAKNPIVQKVALGALTTAVPELAPFTIPLGLGTSMAVDEANNLVGQGRRKLKGGADAELFARLRDMIADASRHGVKITKTWVKENAVPYLRKRGAKLGEKATTAILDWARSVQYGNEISIPDIGANWEDVEEEPDYDIIDKKDYDGSGRLSKKEKYYQEHNPYEHLKKGAFTRDLRAFNKKHNKKHTLKQFAMLIAKHPTSFKPLERKRALFYLNMIV